MAQRRGFALITVLGVMSLLLLLGLMFLEYIEADYRFAAQQDRRQQAYDLALSGLEYQRQRNDLLHPDPGGPMQIRKAVPLGSLTHFFEVTVEPNGRIISRGVVQNSFRELAQHRLVIEPGGSLPEAHTLL